MKACKRVNMSLRFDPMLRRFAVIMLRDCETVHRRLVREKTPRRAMCILPRSTKGMETLTIMVSSRETRIRHIKGGVVARQEQCQHTLHEGSGITTHIDSQCCC